MKRSLGAQALGLTAPVWVVGSCTPQGRPNLMVASWGGICCSTPPMLSISLRKTRLTHANIMATGAFTINVPSQEFLIQADYLGRVSGKEADKFAAAGLTALQSELVAAPFVKEFPLVIECTLWQATDLGSHTQFIGRIVDVKADEAVLDDGGAVNADKVRPLIASSGDRAYYGLGPYLDRAYAPGLLLPLGAGRKA